jgi:predicted phosphodiesterase
VRYLICGDIHGNLPALEKLLKIEKGNYDSLICHGDLVNYAPWSNECVQLMESVPNAEILMGNHEEYFINGHFGGSHPVANAFFDFCYSKFTELQTIQDYKDKIELKNFTVKHTVLDKYIFENTDLEGVNFKTNYIIGHSHHQFKRDVNGKKIVNTGSLGQNRKHINIANYIIYDEALNDIELKFFPVDIDLVIDQMRKENYPSICIDYYMNKERKKL